MLSGTLAAGPSRSQFQSETASLQGQHRVARYKKPGILKGPGDKEIIRSFADRAEEAFELSALQKFKKAFKNDLIAGLLVVIPLATTIWLTVTLGSGAIEFLTRIPKQFNPFVDLEPWIGDLLNLAVGLSVPLGGILLIGLMARNIGGQWLLDVSERTVQAIPLAGSIYKTLKQLLETLLKDSQSRFRRVVLVEYPRPGIWTMGFVTGQVKGKIHEAVDVPALSVFFPTTPNPTSGWYCIVPIAQAIDLDISVEDAFKILVSGGIVTPTQSLTPLRNRPGTPPTPPANAATDEASVMTVAAKGSAVPEDA